MRCGACRNMMALPVRPPGSTSEWVSKWSARVLSALRRGPCRHLSLCENVIKAPATVQHRVQAQRKDNLPSRSTHAHTHRQQTRGSFLQPNAIPPMADRQRIGGPWHAGMSAPGLEPWTPAQAEHMHRSSTIPALPSKTDTPTGKYGAHYFPNVNCFYITHST